MADDITEETYAVIDAIFRNGQPFFRVHIIPFRMTNENRERYSCYTLMSFWKDLWLGHNQFIEGGGIPF